MKKRVCPFLIMLTYILMLTACAQTDGVESSTWQEQYDLGIRYLTEGNYEEAIIAFTAAIEIDPKQSPAFVGRGDAHSGIARILADGVEELPTEAVSSYESAIVDYLAALDLDESMAEVYQKAAELYVRLGDTDAAIALLERGISLTGNEELQACLEELTAVPSRYVLIQQDAYSAINSEEHHSTYSYDKAGFEISWDTWRVYDEGVENYKNVTWSYDRGEKLG